MKKFGLMLLMLLLLLSGCTGGQEIESGLFVIAMAVDAAPEGNLTVTVKALSRRGRNHIPATFFASDDLSHLLELLRIGKRTSSKFYNFFHSDNDSS